MAGLSRELGILMAWVGELWRRVAFQLRRVRFQEELDEEFQHHLELKVRALDGKGLSQVEAYYAARRARQYDPMAREESRYVGMDLA